MLEKLQQYYKQAFPTERDPRVSNLIQINDGWESDVYAFQVESGPPTGRNLRELILRIYPGQDAYDKSANEFRSLALVRQAGYPVPQVYCLERDHSPFERPFLIMEKIQGRSMWPLIFQNPNLQDANRQLDFFCSLFVRLHQLDWHPFVPDPLVYEPGTPGALIERQLSRIRSTVYQYPMPGMIRVFEWLENNKLAASGSKASLIHWDFHPHNILACHPGQHCQEPAYVIDWTGQDISDYRFDLAWTLLLIGSYQGLEAREAILRSYEQQAGQPVEALPYYDVAAAFRRLFSIVFSIKYGAQALGMRPGAENIMREQREPIRRIYTLLQSHCGLEIPEVEELLT